MKTELKLNLIRIKFDKDLDSFINELESVVGKIILNTEDDPTPGIAEFITDESEDSYWCVKPGESVLINPNNKSILCSTSSENYTSIYNIDGCINIFMTGDNVKSLKYINILITNRK
jgi:hypothetical protein